MARKLYVLLASSGTHTGICPGRLFLNSGGGARFSLEISFQSTTTYPSPPPIFLMSLQDSPPNTPKQSPVYASGSKYLYYLFTSAPISIRYRAILKCPKNTFHDKFFQLLFQVSDIHCSSILDKK